MHWSLFKIKKKYLSYGTALRTQTNLTFYEPFLFIDVNLRLFCIYFTYLDKYTQHHFQIKFFSSSILEEIFLHENLSFLPILRFSH